MNHHNRASHPSGSLPPAVVVGLTETGLGLVRALGRKGIKVIGIGPDPKIAGARSRYCSQVIQARIDDEQLIETLLLLGKKHANKPVLLLSEDSSVIVISEHMERLKEYYRFLLPEKNVIDDMMYKQRFHELIKSSDIPKPDTIIVRTSEEVSEAGVGFKYPCIIKPCVRTNLYNEHISEKGFRASNPEELNRAYETISPWEKEAIIQEWIPGTDAEIIFCLLYFDAQSRCRAVVPYRKLRQWYPEAGSTSMGVTIQHEWVEKASIRFFESVGFRGLGSTEFKRDPRDGQFKIVEPCVGRANLASYIAVEAGVNIPYLYYCDLAGKPLKSQKPTLGVKWVHEVNDLRSALHYFRKGELSIKDWIRSMRGRKSYAFFCWDDSAPFFQHLFDLLAKFLAFLK